MTIDKNLLTQRMSMHMNLENGSIYAYDIFYGDKKIGVLTNTRNGKEKSSIAIIDNIEFSLPNEKEELLRYIEEKITEKEPTRDAD